MALTRGPFARWAGRVAKFVVGLIVLLALAIFGFLYWQASQKPATDGQYVALGSSFAAGLGLGPRAVASPVQCFRSTGGYPALAAKRTGLRLVDMSCSGSTTEHILHGGQMLLGPQLAAIGPQARLVTITSGGNDIGYVGDLMAASGSMGPLAGWANGAIKSAADRPYTRVAANLEKIVGQVRKRAPKALIVIVSYPALMPREGNCAATGVSDAQADISRSVAARLVEVTRNAAAASDAAFVDMDALSVGHDVCSASPWVNGVVPSAGTAFHPNAAGAAATAAQVDADYRNAIVDTEQP